MRWLLPAVLLGVLSVVEALNAQGKNKLLVVLEELAEKTKYSKYIADLEGTSSGVVFGTRSANWGDCSERIFNYI